MKTFLLAALIPFAAAIAADAPGASSSKQATAQVKLTASSGSSVTGTLKLMATGDGVSVMGDIAGLPPKTEHGFHVHETGDCSAPNAASAGGHFNPDHAQHGGPGITPHHLGDIPNIVADESGHASVNATIGSATLGDGGPHDLMGKAFIVHAKPDNYVTQPSGDSGDRIACGVVRR